MPFVKARSLACCEKLADLSLSLYFALRPKPQAPLYSIKIAFPIVNFTIRDTTYHLPPFFLPSPFILSSKTFVSSPSFFPLPLLHFDSIMRMIKFSQIVTKTLTKLFFWNES